jgi:CRP/FNR family transcriptional regulator
MLLTEKIALLKKSPIFSALGDREASDLGAMAFERHIKRSQFLFREGESCENFYILADGRLRTFLYSSLGRDVTLFTPLRSGEVLGPTSIFRNRPPSGSMQAAAATRVLGFKKDEFIRFLTGHPAVMMELIKVLAARVSELNRRLRDVAGERVEQRLFHVIHTLYRRYGPRLQITRHELAEMVGATRETVIRSLSSLKRRKIISSSRGRMTILDADRLKLLCEDASEDGGAHS